jgi:hypothetical protein
MLTYLREELNENRHIVIFLNSLKDKMESIEDVKIIKEEMDKLTDVIEIIRKEYHELLGKELSDRYESSL